MNLEETLYKVSEEVLRNPKWNETVERIAFGYFNYCLCGGIATFIALLILMWVFHKLFWVRRN